MVRSIRRLAFALALAALAAGCATNPVTGRRELSLVSSAKELQLGQEGYPAVVQEYGVYPDTSLQAYVDRVGQRVARVSHLPDLQWHFTLLDDPTVNAFAMPGGYIYITRGIVAHLNSEAQLAGVLGHEIGHVTHRHAAEQMTQQQLFGLGLGVASVFSSTVQRYSDLAQQGLGLLFLKYSRQDESEADELGVEYATRAGYDPREIPGTYSMLKRVSDQAGQRLPGYLSTHPDPGDRETRTAELARAAAKGRTGMVVNENGYVRRLDGIVFGQDPREGYFRGDEYVQPTMGFALRFPAGWTHQDSRSAVTAQEPKQQAAMQLALAPDAGALTPADYVRQLGSRGTVSEARGDVDRIGGYDAWVGHLVVPQQGQAPAVLAAGFIRRGEGQLFEVLGKSQAPGDANDLAILASLRSFHAVSDPALTDVKPDRVRVLQVPETGGFADVAKRLGGAPAFLDEDAIMNDVQADEEVRAGTLVKVVVAGRR